MAIKMKKKRIENSRLQCVGVSVLAVLCGLAVFSRTLNNGDLHPSLISHVVTRTLREQTSTTELYLRKETKPDTSSKYKAISCPTVLQEARKAANRQTDPNEGVLHGKQIKADPSFWMSLHNEKFDVTRWHIMETGEYYEKQLTNAFTEVLKETPAGARVIDVGGNIGYFTLLSAANGPVTVDTFEPNPKNRLRVCESLLLNHWHSEFDNDFTGDSKEVSKVNLYPYGIGRKEGVFSFKEHANPGQGKFSEVHSTGNVGDNGLQVVTLDNFARERGWFKKDERISILKVDVEGMEFSVIEGAIELLNSKIAPRHIFMEVSAREAEEIEINKPALKLLSQSGYKLHKIGGWRGPSKPVDFPQDDNIADHIMKRTLEEAAKQLNLWWKLES